MSWEPTEQEIGEKLIEMAYRWGDIEEDLVVLADHPDAEWNSPDDQLLHAMPHAFRVEAQFTRNDFGDPCSVYVLSFDVADGPSRTAFDTVQRNIGSLREHINFKAAPWHSRDNVIARLVPRETPVEGQICRRAGEDHPVKLMPSLDDVPTFQPSSSAIPLEKRGPYWLTPIEAPFYDALAETGLTFAVQPWIQTADDRVRIDFVVFYNGGMVAVELDGHDFHKTKEQRGKDAQRDRDLQKRGFRVVRFTGSQVFESVDGCIKELRDVLRQSELRP